MTHPAARPRGVASGAGAPVDGCERLGPVDAMFLDLEEPCAHMHVGGVLRFEGRPPRHDALVAHVASRLDRVPRYRQQLAPVPLHLGRPVWVDAASLDVAWHVPRLALPAPGEAGLKALAARFLSSPPARARGRRHERNPSARP